MEVQIINSKFKSVGSSLPFINYVIRTFKERNIVDQNNITDDNDDEHLLPPYFFEVNKCFILLKLPFCQNNEIKSEHFLKKIPSFYKKIILILQSVRKQGKYKLSVSFEA